MSVRGAWDPLKGLLFAACGLAVLAGPGGACAGDVSPAGANAAANPDYRLLVLDGGPVRWTVPPGGLPANVTYAFLPAPRTFPGARNCDGMLPPEAALAASHIDAGAFRREARAAFSIWAATANITFEEVAPDANPGILIGADAKARGRAFTNVALFENGQRLERAAGRSTGTIRQALICLNPEQPWKIGFDGNLEVYDLRFTLAHEIGHAIGLDHPGPEGELMSFRYAERSHGLMAGDIAGAVLLYGRKGEAPSDSQSLVAASQGAFSRDPTPLKARTASPPSFGLGESSAAHGAAQKP